MHVIVAAVVGFGVGVFCPAVARKAKAAFSKEVAVVKSDVKADASKAVADIKAKV